MGCNWLGTGCIKIDLACVIILGVPRYFVSVSWCENLLTAGPDTDSNTMGQL
jgi:hypothetical protein